MPSEGLCLENGYAERSNGQAEWSLRRTNDHAERSVMLIFPENDRATSMSSKGSKPGANESKGLCRANDHSKLYYAEQMISAKDRPL